MHACLKECMEARIFEAENIWGKRRVLESLVIQQR
jgi:hypothetical protein